MSYRAHLIEIERLVLNGIQPGDAGGMHALIASEVFQQLQWTDSHAFSDLGDAARTVSTQVAQTVVRSLQDVTNDLDVRVSRG